MKTLDKYVGLDVHKDTTVIAWACLEKILRKIGGEGITLHVVYEAGPTGFVTYRRLQQLEIDCLVVAPAKTPQEKGRRQTNDRRDAVQLARLHRTGERTGINVPET